MDFERILMSWSNNKIVCHVLWSDTSDPTFYTCHSEIDREGRPSLPRDLSCLAGCPASTPAGLFCRDTFDRHTLPFSSLPPH